MRSPTNRIQGRRPPAARRAAKLAGRTRRAPLFAVLTLATAVLTGCGSTVTGHPLAAEIDVRTLDVGGIDTHPFDVPADSSHDPHRGRQLAAMRLADHAITGREIDPALVYSLTNDAVDPAATGDVYGTPGLSAPSDTDILQRERMLFGYSFQVTDQKDRVVWGESSSLPAELAAVTILQLPDEATATRTAGELADAESATAAGDQAVVLPGHGQARTFVRADGEVVDSFLAHGSYVVNLLIRVETTDLGALSTLADKAYTAQLPLLDSLPPLSGREMVLQDIDSNGMLRRTIHAGTVDSPSPSLATAASYGPQAFVHSQHDIAWTADAIAAAGVDAAGFSNPDQDRTVTLRTRDDDAASNLLRAYTTRPGFQPESAPPKVPDAFCFTDTTVRGNEHDSNVCFLRYRRYVGIVRSTQAIDAEQRAAAQYALFANSQ